MRTNIWLFAILSTFFGASAAVYAGWSLIEPTGYQLSVAELTGVVPPEWVGTVGISLSSILALFITFYLWRTQASVGADLPEDRTDAGIDDGDPEVGFFSPWSWWPLALAFGLALMFLGLAIGVWITIIGAPIAAISVVGWVYEYYRGNFAR
ncbi:MAG: cytochrome c oxidase subunit 4 [Actinomycetales bacterium]|nr:cytochrome c oxidase subunit 4 [Actinomycetales bacterium]